MKVDDVKQIIDYLCEKFNVAQEYLVPAMQKYALVKDLSISFILLIVSFAIIFAWWKLYKKYHNDYDFDDFLSISAFCIGIGTLISLAIIVVYIHDAIVWGACPDMALMDYIINRA